MRPIDKAAPGDSLTLEDGTPHVVGHTYNPYKLAKAPLRANIGAYCSYCEHPLRQPPNMHVEHILPVNNGFAHLQFSWDNFLVACGTCNGAGNKGRNVALPADCHYPHLNNTFLSLRYIDRGIVTVNPDLSGISRLKAQRLLDLVGLGKSPSQHSPQDNRWRLRAEIWEIAKRYKDMYDAGKLNPDLLLDLIKARGYWSIWFTVFEGADDIRRRLIDEFPGTSSQCFDPADHFRPIPRNPGQADPI